MLAISSNRYLGLGDDSSFSCTAKICFGVDANKRAELQSLQTAINRYAAQFNFAPLKIDGFIGTDSLAAAKIALRGANQLELAPGEAFPADTAAVIANLTKEALTRDAVDITNLLNRVASAAPGQANKPRLWPWVLAGGAAVVVVGIFAARSAKHGTKP